MTDISEMFEKMTERDILVALYNEWGQLRIDFVTLRKAIYGNGAIGLIEAQRSLTQRVLDITRIATILGGIILTLIIGLLWGIFTGQVTIVFAR